MTVPLSDERPEERIRRWIDEGRPVNATVELLGEVDRLRDALEDVTAAEQESTRMFYSVCDERDTLRAQVEAVLALADEADALIEERGLRRNGFIKSIRAALDKEAGADE